MAREGRVIPTTEYLAVAREFAVDLTVVGPEAPLVAGVVDEFRAAGLRIIGPDRVNAQLEASKTYSKRFMNEAGIPTARFVEADTIEDAKTALETFPLPVVIKADGLAAGKGVIIAHTSQEAEAAIESLGPKLVIEEFLAGEEVSFIALCDGRNVLPFEPTQDHKAVHDNDEGPNTGGMGAYCDSRILTARESAHIMDAVMRPAVERTGFTGFLYAGLMMTADGPKTLEFNVRLGDPETQALMHRMDCDFGEVLLACAEARLETVQFRWKPEPSVAIVLAAEGYPAKVRTGDEIHGIDAAESKGATVYQAGTRIDERSKLLTSGGRVLAVTASAPTLEASISRAYEAASEIHFDGMHYRRDIGRKGLKRWLRASVVP